MPFKDPLLPIIVIHRSIVLLKNFTKSRKVAILPPVDLEARPVNRVSIWAGIKVIPVG